MISERERQYLQFISDSIVRVEEYLPAGPNAFRSDPMRQDAVVWRLQSIADAARNHLSDDLKKRHPDVRWQAVYGFRNVAAHQYADINLDLVWEIASSHLSALKEAVLSELQATL